MVSREPGAVFIALTGESASGRDEMYLMPKRVLTTMLLRISRRKAAKSPAYREAGHTCRTNGESFFSKSM